MYSETNLVRIARRENNNKRSYLVLNTLQGKHLPAPPREALRLFAALADLVKAGVAGERVLVVGFAETATAIGAAIAAELGCAYIQTTRESVEGRNYLYFTEAHSHATEQKLDKGDIARVLPNIDCIVFAEDELTTGNTILDLVGVLEHVGTKQVRFAAACLISGLPHEARMVFEARGIALHALLSVDHSGYPAQALACQEDGLYHGVIPPLEGQEELCASYPGRLDARRLISGSAYQGACEGLWQRVRGNLCLSHGERILVLGTEEFMYPGLLIAAKMEACGASVRFHATTRSPMLVSAQAADPLHIRYELKSLYDSERRTFLYELAAYDRVLVVTDAPAQQTEGLCTLLAALRQAENQSIHVIRWCDT